MKLLEPITIGNMTLKNRIIFPPLTTGYEERDGSIGPRSLGFYKRLAKGGVSYIVIGDVAPVPTASPTPKLYDDRQIPTFKAIADTLHEYDAKVALQIFHPEYDVPGVGKMIRDAGMARGAAAKAKAEGNEEEAAKQTELAAKITRDAYAKLHHDMQHFVSEATIEQLTAIKDSIVACTVKANKAGIDAIEVHGDRLVGSLCSSVLNHRTDEYGGSFENRVRYALELVKAMKEAAPDVVIEYKLPIRTLNEDGTIRGKGGLVEEEAIEFSKLLEQAGVDMIQVAQANHTGNMGDTIPPMGSRAYNWTLPTAKKIKAVVNVPIITVGRVLTVEAGEEILQKGEADLIGYGRSLLTDPDIALKAERGEPIRTCLNCNKGCLDAIQNRRYISCVLNAENGDEETIFITPATSSKKIAVVGAGIAGLEAARVAAIKGHEVTVYEKEDKIGGQVNIAAIPPRKSEILRAIEYYPQIFPQLGVEVKLNTVPSADEINTYDQVIVAIGSHDLILPIEGSTQDNVVSSWDVLNGKEVKGKVAVIGGGLVGTETTEYIANKGYEVSIIEMTDKIANGESTSVLPLIMEDFAKHHVTQYTNTTVNQIDGTSIIATQGEETITIPADTVVMAVGSKKNEYDISAITIPVSYAGDCSGDRTADIASAIRGGYKAGNEI